MNVLQCSNEEIRKQAEELRANRER